MHLRPAEGAPQPVGRAIVDHLFPDPDDSGRIPIVGVAGSRHTTQIARLLAWVMQLGGRHVGLACRDGLFLDRRRVEAGDCTRWDAGRRLLINRNVEAAVFENDASAILQRRPGLRPLHGRHRHRPGAASRRWPSYEVHDVDQMLKVLRTQVDVVLADGVAVLNGGDERVAALARAVRRRRGAVCAGRTCAAARQAQRAAGARAVFLRDGDCVLAEGPAEIVLPRLAPLSRAGRHDLGARGAARRRRCRPGRMGIAADLITAGVQTFGPAPVHTRASTPHARTARRQKGGRLMDAVPHPRAARAQPVEPAHGHRGHRALRRGRARHRSGCPPSSRACARCSLRSPSPGPIDEGPLSMAQVLEARGADAAGPGRLPGDLQPHLATGEAGTYQVVVEYSEEPVGRLALELARELIAAAADGGSFDAAAAVTRLREIDEDLRLGPSTGSIVNAAIARGIPYRRLTDGSLVQFGWGAKQRRIQAAEVDTTSAVAEIIAQDKHLTKALLQAAGVPVPIGRPVRDADDAWAVAQRDRPAGGGQAAGRQPGQGRDGQRRHARASERGLPAASAIGTVMIEKYLAGGDFRLLVVGKKLVAAARRDPPLVIGDGVLTRERTGRARQCRSAARRRACHLADARAAGHHRPRPGCGVQGLEPDSVPAKGRRVMLRHNANLSTGGSATDVTDDVHPGSRGARRGGGADGGPAHLRRGRGLRKRAAPAGRAARRRGRGQRRAWTAHAPDAVLRQGPQCRRGHHRPPLRPRRRRSRAGGGRHRHQRQDHRDAADRAPVGHRRPARGHDQHRRRLRAGPADRQRRLQRPAQRAQRTGPSRCRRGRVRDSARRHPARRAWASTAARWRWSRTSAKATTSA